MHDPAYKRIFSRPRMVEDLLRGFAARDWSHKLDFESLSALPASFVTDDLRQRHGDLVWRVRFRDDRWLYLLLLLEFQVTVDPAMAFRMLAYTVLLYQKLIREGVLQEHGELPPVLPVVLYNGSRRWTAVEEASELVATRGDAVLKRYQPSQRYFVLDEGRASDLPRENLVSALIELETNRDGLRVPELLSSLGGLLRERGDAELGRAFEAWVEHVLKERRFPGLDTEPLLDLEEVAAMFSERVREWTEEWAAEGREQGIAQGIAQGRAEERALLCRLAARKFDAVTARRLADALADVADPVRLTQVGDWIIECETAAELLARVAGDRRQDA